MGQAIPPMVIFQGKNFNHSLSHGEVPGTLYGPSYSDHELFFGWFQSHFLEYAVPSQSLLLLQWKLSITVTFGPTVCDLYIQVAVIQKTCIKWSPAMLWVWPRYVHSNFTIHNNHNDILSHRRLQVKEEDIDRHILQFIISLFIIIISYIYASKWIISSCSWIPHISTSMDTKNWWRVGR